MAEPIIEEQHAIPQQISAFQFHLVGDMTLKQFLQLAGGALVALVVYASGLPGFIKWPLIFISFGFGAALAFLPFEDRPLAQWIFSFFKSIYSPTFFIWQKTVKAPQFFAPEAPPEKAPAEVKVPPTIEPVRQVIYVAPESKEETKLEEQEKSFLMRISQIAGHKPPPGPATVVAGISPVLPIEPVLPVEPVQPKPKLIKKKPPKKEVLVPQAGVVTLAPEKKEEEKPQKPPPPEEISTSVVAPIIGKKGEITTKAAQFSKQAAPPMPPSKPNIIVGQVVDPDGKIVEGAILEIKDEEARPVRALKTNQLGHFIIVTPLLSGKYEIITEKEGLTFEPVSFTASGEIIPPIAIWAKRDAEGSNKQINTNV